MCSRGTSIIGRLLGDSNSGGFVPLGGRLGFVTKEV